MGGLNDDLRGRIEASWQALLTAVEQVPEARLQERGAVGDWSVKDLLGHIAYWDEEAAGRVRRSLAGKPAGPTGDYEPINLREAERRASWPLAEVRAELGAAHAALLDALDAADAAGVTVSPAAVDGATREHYDEHLADLHSYRQRVGD